MDHLGSTSDEMLDQDRQICCVMALEASGTEEYSSQQVSQRDKADRMMRRTTPDKYTAYDHQLKTLLEEGHIELLPRDYIPSHTSHIEVSGREEPGRDYWVSSKAF